MDLNREKRSDTDALYFPAQQFSSRFGNGFFTAKVANHQVEGMKTLLYLKYDLSFRLTKELRDSVVGATPPFLSMCNAGRINGVKCGDTANSTSLAQKYQPD